MTMQTQKRLSVATQIADNFVYNLTIFQLQLLWSFVQTGGKGKLNLQ